MIVILLIIFMIACLTLVALVGLCVRGYYENVDKRLKKDDVYNISGMGVKENNLGKQKGVDFGPVKQDSITYICSQGNGYGKAWILTLTNLDDGKRYSIRFRKAICVGRGKNRTVKGYLKLALPEEDCMIARIHCIIQAENGRLYIQDCGSKNHTYLDGQMVISTEKIRQGSIIQMGTSKFSVEYVDEVNNR